MVNLTGHELTLVSWDGIMRHVPASGQVRVRSRVEEVGHVRYEDIDIPLLEIVEQSVNLPDPEPDTLYVVSGIVAAKARRPDFVVPSRIVRDGNGRAVGCQALAKVRT